MCILTRAIIVVQRDTHSVSLTTLVLFYFFSLISGPQRQRPPNDLHWDENDIHPLFFLFLPIYLADLDDDFCFPFFSGFFL